jgi:hypothetical protein
MACAASSWMLQGVRQIVSGICSSMQLSCSDQAPGSCARWHHTTSQHLQLQGDSQHHVCLGTCNRHRKMRRYQADLLDGHQLLHEEWSGSAPRMVLSSASSLLASSLDNS